MHNVDMCEEPIFRDGVLFVVALVTGIGVGEWFHYCDSSSGVLPPWQSLLWAIVGTIAGGIIRLVIPYDATLVFKITRGRKQ